MNNKFLTTAIVGLGLAIATPALAEEPSAEGAQPSAKETCANYAQEDGVKADEMEAYIARCVKELSDAPAGDPDAPAAEEGQAPKE